MAKKLVLTEQQFHTILNVVKEQKYDDMITKYQKERKEGVNIPIDDLRLLINLGMNWCKGKDSHPDCEEILRIRADLNLYN